MDGRLCVAIWSPKAWHHWDSPHERWRSRGMMDGGIGHVDASSATFVLLLFHHLLSRCALNIGTWQGGSSRCDVLILCWKRTKMQPDECRPKIYLPNTTRHLWFCFGTVPQNPLSLSSLAIQAYPTFRCMWYKHVQTQTLGLHDMTPTTVAQHPISAICRPWPKS